MNFSASSVAVIGQGYVGLPLALLFAEAGLKTIGLDIDPKKVHSLMNGESYIDYIPASRISDVVNRGTYEASTDCSRLTDVDAIIICVPTPLDAHNAPDLSYLLGTTKTVAKHLRKGHLVVLESTTYPRCTRDDILPVLQESGLTLDKDFLLAFSPEREDPSNGEFNTSNIPKLVGGITEPSTKAAVELYAKIIAKVVAVSSAEIAEAAKLLENIFRAVNIALVNELKSVYHEMSIDIWEVIAAASTKPFGFMPFYPGPGIGGHCIPIDPFYLTWKARQYGSESRFIELAGYVNSGMPRYVFQRAADALNDEAKSVKGSRILIIGVAYKPNVGDERESPSLDLIELFLEAQALVDYHDPYVPELASTRKHPEKAGMRSVQLSPETISDYDIVVIVTAHESIDYKTIHQNTQIIVDTRNVFADLGIQDKKIIKA